MHHAVLLQRQDLHGVRHLKRVIWASRPKRWPWQVMFFVELNTAKNMLLDRFCFFFPFTVGFPEPCQKRAALKFLEQTSQPL